MTQTNGALRMMSDWALRLSKFAYKIISGIFKSKGKFSWIIGLILHSSRLVLTSSKQMISTSCCFCKGFNNGDDRFGPRLWLYELLLVTLIRIFCGSISYRSEGSHSCLSDPHKARSKFCALEGIYKRILKWYCDENHIFPIEPFLKHKQVACMTRKMLFTIFKYLFSFRRYLSF